MINVIHMNQIGVDGLRPVMYFEFGFSNSSDLPKNNIFQLGDKICVIGNGSIAVSNVDKTAFVFTNGQWVKSNNVSITNPNPNIITSSGSYDISNNDVEGFNKLTVNGGSVTLIEKGITANGTYTASDDNVDGYSEVTVNVTTIGMPKLATPTAVASAVENYNKQYIYTNTSTFQCANSMFGVENAPPQYVSKIINIFTYKPTVITIPYDNGYNDTLDLLFTAGNSFAVKYYDYPASTSATTVSLSQNFENGKVYRVKLQIGYATNQLEISQKSITEYNEPIKFTVT